MAIRKKISGLFLAIILLHIYVLLFSQYGNGRSGGTAGGTGHGKPPSGL